MADGDELRRAREERLREEVEGLERALEGFGDPDTAARPGLQLMGEAVKTKYDDVRSKYERSDTLGLEVVVSGGPIADALVDALLVARLMAELVPLARRLATELVAAIDPPPTEAQLDAALGLRFDGLPAEGIGFRLVGPRRAARELVPGPDGCPSLLEASLRRVLELVGEPGSSELDPLRGLLRDTAGTAELTLYPPFDDPVSGTLDGAARQ